jgi:hypothetical protein
MLPSVSSPGLIPLLHLDHQAQVRFLRVNAASLRSHAQAKDLLLKPTRGPLDVRSQSHRAERGRVWRGAHHLNHVSFTFFPSDAFKRVFKRKDKAPGQSRAINPLPENISTFWECWKKVILH